MRVKVASGSHIKTQGLCLQLQVKIQSQIFYTDCYVIDSNDYDLVLGTSWLKLLGQIKWNFKDLTMPFVWEDKEMRGLQMSKLL